MTEQDKVTKPKPALKEVVAESTEKLEQVAKEASEQVTEAVVESKEKLEAEANINEIYQDIIEWLKTQGFYNNAKSYRYLLK